MVYIYPLIAGILYGIGTLLNKKVANLLDNPWLSSFIFNLASTLVSVFLLVYDLNNGGILISTSFLDWLLIFASMLLTTFAFWGMFTSMRELPVSEQMLLSRFSIITYTLGGFLLLGETVSWIKFVGLMLVLSGILFSSLRKGKFVFNKWVIIQLLASICFGLTVIVDKVASIHFSPGFWVFINISTTTLAIFVLAYLNGSLKNLKTVSNEYYRYTLGAGAVMATAYYFNIASYGLGGLVILVGALSQIKILVAVAGGYIFFKERSDLFVKFVGVITVIIGLILLKF